MAGVCFNRPWFPLMLGLVVLIGSRDAVQGAQPGAFCVPDGWQSGRTVTLATANNSTKPSMTRSIGDIIYSTSLKKIWIDDFVIGGGGQRLTRIFDYPGHVLYTVVGEDGDREQTCKKTSLSEPFTPYCVPENATMTHYKSYYGMMPYIEYFIEFSGKVNDTNYRISMSRAYDTPLFQQSWGKDNGERFFRTDEYYNTTVWGNIPPDIFKPPAVCNNVPLSTMAPGGVMDRLHGLLPFH